MITFEAAEQIADKGITRQKKVSAYDNGASWIFAYKYTAVSSKTIPGAALVEVKKTDGTRNTIDFYTFKSAEKKLIKSY